MSVESETNYRAGSKLHIPYFVLGTLSVIGSLTIPDLINLDYWYLESIEVGFAILSAILYAYSVRTYLRKDVKVTVGETLGLNESWHVKVNKKNSDE